VLPQAGVLPYAPFLKTAPFANGHLHPAWIGAFGVPAILVAFIVVVMQISLLQQLRERQVELESLSGTAGLTGLANRTAFFKSSKPNWRGRVAMARPFRSRCLMLNTSSASMTPLDVSKATRHCNN